MNKRAGLKCESHFNKSTQNKTYLRGSLYASMPGYLKTILLLLLLLLILEILGETRIVRIIIQIIIIRAGTSLVNHSFNFNWKPKCIYPKILYILDSRLSGRNYL